MKKIFGCIVGIAMLFQYVYAENTKVEVVGNALIEVYEKVLYSKGHEKKVLLVEKTYEILEDFLASEKISTDREKSTLILGLQDYLMSHNYFDTRDMERYRNDHLALQVLVPSHTEYRNSEGDEGLVEVVVEESIEKAFQGFDGTVHIKPTGTTRDEFPAWEIQVMSIDHTRKDEMINEFIRKVYSVDCAYGGSIIESGNVEYKTINVVPSEEGKEKYGEDACIMNYIQSLRYYVGEDYDVIVQRGIGHDNNFSIGQRAFDTTMTRSLKIMR